MPDVDIARIKGNIKAIDFDHINDLKDLLLATDVPTQRAIGKRFNNGVDIAEAIIIDAEMPQLITTAQETFAALLQDKVKAATDADIAVLRSIALATNAIGVRKALNKQDKFGKIDFSMNGNDSNENLLTKEAAFNGVGSLQVLARTRIAELLKAKVQAATDADIAVLRAIAVADDGAGVREALSNQAKFGNLDFKIGGNYNSEKLLSNTAATTELQKLAQEKIEALLKAKVQSATDDDIAVLRGIAVADDGAGVREALSNQANFGKLDFKIGDNYNSEKLLSNTAATTELQKLAQTKIAALINEKIAKKTNINDDNLQAIIAAGNNQGNDATRAALIRTAMDSKRVAFGINIEINDSKIISDTVALEIYKNLSQRNNEHSIVENIKNYSLDDITFLRNIHSAADDKSARNAINDCRAILGLPNLDVSSISAENIIKIKQAALDKYSEKIIIDRVKNCIYTDVLEEIIAAAAAPNIKTVLNSNKSKIGNVAADNIPDDILLEIQKFAKQRKAFLADNPIVSTLLERQSGVLSEAGFEYKHVHSQDEVKAFKLAAINSAGVVAGTIENNSYIARAASKNSLIVAKADFSEIEKSGKSKGDKIVTLVQDHKGRVTDLLTETSELSPVESAKKALAQASAALSGYIARGDTSSIVIRGRDTKQAEMVHAALLYLITKDPSSELAKIKIDAISGEDGPNKGWIRGNSAFIHRQLPMSDTGFRKMLDLEAGHLARFSTKAEHMREQTKTYSEVYSQAKARLNLSVGHIEKISDAQGMLNYLSEQGFPAGSKYLAQHAANPKTPQQILEDSKTFDQEITDGLVIEDQENNGFKLTR